MRLNSIKESSVIPVVTSGAVTADVASLNLSALPGGLPPNISLGVEGTLVGRDGSGNTVIIKSGRAAKTVSGTLSLPGSVTSMIPASGDASLTSASLTFTTSGSSIVLQATGVAAVDISWTGHIEVWSSEF